METVGTKCAESDGDEPFLLAHMKSEKRKRGEKKDQTSLTYEFVRDCQLTWVIFVIMKRESKGRGGSVTIRSSNASDGDRIQNWHRQEGGWKWKWICGKREKVHTLLKWP